MAVEAKQSTVDRLRAELGKLLKGEERQQPSAPRPMASIHIISTSGRNGRSRKTA